MCHIARYCVIFRLFSAPLPEAPPGLVAIPEIEYETIRADMHRDIQLSILQQYYTISTGLVYRIELAPSRQISFLAASHQRLAGGMPGPRAAP